MRALAIIGCTIVGGAVGAGAGIWIGWGQDDLQMAAGLNALAGAAIGCVAGASVGATIFA